MRGVLQYLGRKIGPFTNLFYPEVSQIFYDPEKKSIGVGDGSLNPPVMLTENNPQSMTNKTIDARLNTIKNLPGVGSFTVTASDVPPDLTYRACDGSLLQRSVYKELFANINTLYGAGDGSTTFALPGPNVMGAIQSPARVWIKALP